MTGWRIVGDLAATLLTCTTVAVLAAFLYRPKD